MKKVILLTFVLILVLSVLCGCENNASPELLWEYNFEEHWRTDENGEKTESGKHQLDSQDICSVSMTSIPKVIILSPNMTKTEMF